MSISRVFGIVAVFAFIFAMSACTSHTDGNKAWQLINDGALLVDVRTPREFSGGHVPGAKLIPISEVESRIAEFGEDKNREIVVYCKSGGRAGKAEKILRSQGYTNVYNAGGYNDLMSTKPSI